MKHKFLLLYCWFVRTLLFFFPDMPLFMRLRGWLYSFAMKKCGKNFQVVHSAIINTSQSFVIGNNVLITEFVRLNGNPNCVCYIKDNVMIGQGTMISLSNHEFDGESFRNKKSTAQNTTTINHGSWIGANCTITANSTIPAYSIIAAQSCVTHKMENVEKALYGGVPAKLIKPLSI